MKKIVNITLFKKTDSQKLNQCLILDKVDESTKKGCKIKINQSSIEDKPLVMNENKKENSNIEVLNKMFFVKDKNDEYIINSETKDFWKNNNIYK